MRRDYRNRTSSTGWGSANGYSSSWNTQSEEEPVHDYSWKQHIYAKDFQHLSGNTDEEYVEEQRMEPEGFAQSAEDYNAYQEETEAVSEREDAYGEDFKRSQVRNSGYVEEVEEGFGRRTGYSGESYVEENAREMESGMFRKATLLKFVAVFLILIYVMLLLIYTSGSTKPFQEVASAVESSLDKESLLKQDTQALKRYYGLNSADYEGVLLYSAEFSISAEEVLMIETKSEQQVQEVQDAIEERMESRIHTFEGYAPQQVQLLEQAQIQVRGKFIFFAVSPDAENYASVFTKAL